MNTTRRRLTHACIVLVAMLTASCVEGGVGMGVPVSGGGARWSGPSGTPNVLVAGGPVYR